MFDFCRLLLAIGLESIEAIVVVGSGNKELFILERLTDTWLPSTLGNFYALGDPLYLFFGRLKGPLELTLARDALTGEVI